MTEFIDNLFLLGLFLIAGITGLGLSHIVVLTIQRLYKEGGDT